MTVARAEILNHLPSLVVAECRAHIEETLTVVADVNRIFSRADVLLDYVGLVGCRCATYLADWLYEHLPTFYCAELVWHCSLLSSSKSCFIFAV